MTLTQWSRIENGVSGTRRTTIERIARAVDAPLLETYEKAGFVAPSHLEREPPQYAGASDNALNNLTPEEQEQVEEYAAFLRSRREHLN